MIDRRFNTDHTEKVLSSVRVERKRQVDMGRAGHIPHACEAPDTDWGYRIGVLGEEYGECCTDYIEQPETSTPAMEMYHELVQVAAVAVACAESIIAQDSHPYWPVTKMHNVPVGLRPTDQEIHEALNAEWQPTSVSGGSITFRGGSDKMSETEISHSEHRAVLERAMEVYVEREAKYGGIWKTYGWRGCLMQMRSCAERVWRSLWNAPVPDDGPYDTDDLIDLINYAVFAIRNVSSGNRDGTWRYPE